MDGTFLKSDGTYDKERLARLLPKMEEKGMLFAVSSGRSVLAIDALFEDVLDKIAVIAENGSIVQYQGKVIFADFLSKEQYIEIAKAIQMNPFYENEGMLFSGENAAYVLEGATEKYLAKCYHYYENVKVISDYDQMDNDRIFKITTTFNGDTVLDGSDWLDQHLDYITAVTTGFDSIDIILSYVNKGFGIDHLCQELGIDASEVVAFGDNLNDFQMLEYAGKAIATDNARVEIKAVSDEVIGNCNEESVIAYMEGLVE